MKFTIANALAIIDKYKAESTKKMGMTNGEKMQRVYCCEVCEPTTKNDLGVDAVSRKDVHDMLENLPITVEDKWFNWLQKACMRLADLPSVTPQEPKIGHWIANAPQYDMLNPQYICSECGNAHTRITPYCEMCGAKMVELQESEDKE